MKELCGKFCLHSNSKINNLIIILTYTLYAYLLIYQEMKISYPVYDFFTDQKDGLILKSFID